MSKNYKVGDKCWTKEIIGAEYRENTSPSKLWQKQKLTIIKCNECGRILKCTDVWRILKRDCICASSTHLIWGSIWVNVIVSKYKMKCWLCWKLKRLRYDNKGCTCLVKKHLEWQVKNNKVLLRRKNKSYVSKCLKCWKEATTNHKWAEKNCAGCSLPRKYKDWEIVMDRRVVWTKNSYYLMKCLKCKKVHTMNWSYPSWCECSVKVNRENLVNNNNENV